MTTTSPGGSTGLQFIVEGRNQIEAAADGEGSGTVGVDFVRLLRDSSYYPEVKALYHEAGLSLRADLANLHQHANLRPDEAAFRWLARTSVPTGHLQVPELDLHTISDQLVPVQQQEAYYHTLVHRAGDSALLRQAFVQAQGHCNSALGRSDRRVEGAGVPRGDRQLGRRRDRDAARHGGQRADCQLAESAARRR